MITCLCYAKVAVHSYAYGFFKVSYGQLSFPTNGEVYNFSVGDSFVYSFYTQCSSAGNYCTQYYLVTVADKSYSETGDTLYYTFNGYAPYISNTIINLDSPVLHTFSGREQVGTD